MRDGRKCRAKIECGAGGGGGGHARRGKMSTKTRTRQRWRRRRLRDGGQRRARPERGRLLPPLCNPESTIHSHSSYSIGRKQAPATTFFAANTHTHPDMNGYCCVVSIHNIYWGKIGLQDRENGYYRVCSSRIRVCTSKYCTYFPFSCRRTTDRCPTCIFENFYQCCGIFSSSHVYGSAPLF